ncbi:MAG: hypothetical protein GWM90_11010 [Gemmatimonadetes bacterium]|nr:hypothetical protein [Gemmatimonadota bacterium]NIQ54491.1 hypothetical protein [Gemmatimonadota bacterium]NIU78013.1 hypothetical protein [Gammaproteobacteria bacterium]NIX44622.1 hypothetical protein [Gemmatimonadota bacterium]NIY08847.1 hypothetical protein [Gemmatimonadota bacterium]
MNGMNYRRILLGGLLAGLVINISEFVLNGIVLMDQAEAMMAAMGLQYTSWAMPAFVIMAFVWGLGLVTLYAAVRPRFGAGPWTALGVGLGFWLFVSVLPSVMFAAMGLGAGMIGISLVWTLVELPLAAEVGAWAYREAEAPARAPAL